MEKKTVYLGNKPLESKNLRKLKKQASKCQSFMFAISNWTYGGVGGLAACSEWSICCRRHAVVPSFPSHTNLLVGQMHNRVFGLCAPSSLLHGAMVLTSGWLHAASWKWDLLWLALNERVVPNANTSPARLFQSRHFILTFITKALEHP